MSTPAPVNHRGAEDEVLPVVPDQFEVRDADSANWVVRKIAEARAYAEHVKRWAELEVRRAEREEQFFLARFGPQLEQWARQEIARLRRKSIKLPAGIVGFRNHPPSLVVTDEAKLLRWCRAMLPVALKVETRILKSELRDHLEKTGECPDGAEVGGGGTKFYIR